MSDPNEAFRPDPRFFHSATPLRVDEVAALVGGECVGTGSDQAAKKDGLISHVAPVGRAGPDAVVFVEHKKALKENMRAPCAVLTKAESVDAVRQLWPAATPVLVSGPKAAFAAIAGALHQSRSMYNDASEVAEISDKAHIDPTAVVMAGAQIANHVQIGPCAVIGPGVILGEGTVVGAHVSISHARIGKGCNFSAGVRIGEAGFGYVPGPSGAMPIPQLGRVLIADNVDIGANSTVDRGALEDTIIGTGTKIDNLCQIAHNCRLGSHVLIASQTGVSGSCHIGDGVMIGGQVGMADHLTIGAGAVITAKSGLMRDVPAGEKWGGIPAKPARLWLKEIAMLSKLAKKGT